MVLVENDTREAGAKIGFDVTRGLRAGSRREDGSGE